MANAEKLRKDALAETIAAHQAIEPTDHKHREDIGDQVRKAHDEARHLSGGAVPFDIPPAPEPRLMDVITNFDGSVTSAVEVPQEEKHDEVADDDLLEEHDEQDSEDVDDGDEDEPEPEEESEEEKPKPKPKAKPKPAKRKKRG